MKQHSSSPINRQEDLVPPQSASAPRRRILKVCVVILALPTVFALTLFWIYGTDTHHSNRNSIWWTERGRNLIPPGATDISIEGLPEMTILDNGATVTLNDPLEVGEHQLVIQAEQPGKNWTSRPADYVHYEAPEEPIFGKSVEYWGERVRSHATFNSLDDGKRPADAVTMVSPDIISGETRMSAQVFAPQDATGKLPTIVMSHDWGGRAKDLRPDGIALARAGFLVVTFDYRGWGESDARLIATSPLKRQDGKMIAEVTEVRGVVDPRRREEACHYRRHQALR